MTTAKLFKSSHKGRLYKITICTKDNPLLFRKHVFPIFREHCRFSEAVNSIDCRLHTDHKIQNEFKELQLILQDSLDFDKMDFDQRDVRITESNAKEFEKEFIHLEIYIRKKPNVRQLVRGHEETTPNRIKVIDFYHELTEKSFKEELFKIRQKTKNRIENLKRANSLDVKILIKNFSNRFIRTWGPKRPRNLIEMKKDFENFKKNISGIEAMDPNYFDLETKNMYISPIELLFKNTQKFNLKEVSMHNDLTKAIFANDLDDVTFLLTMVETKINEKIGSIGVTPLMFACSCFKGHLKTEFPDNNLQIINLLLMYGSDKTITDLFGYTAKDYIEIGTIVFGHERPLNPSPDQIQGLLDF